MEILEWSFSGEQMTSIGMLGTSFNTLIKQIIIISLKKMEMPIDYLKRTWAQYLRVLQMSVGDGCGKVPFAIRLHDSFKFSILAVTEYN